MPPFFMLKSFFIEEDFMKKFFLFFALFLSALQNFSSITFNFNNSKTFLPKLLEGSAYCQYNGKIYIFGGYNFDREDASSFVYDPTNDSFTSLNNLNQGRYFATASELNGKIYIIGGAKIQSGSVTSLDSVEIYDVSTNTFSFASNLLLPLRGASSVSANGKIYVIGGKTNSGYSSSVFEYDPSSNSWSNLSTAPFSVAYGGAVYISSSNKIYFFGGLTGDTTSSSSYFGQVYSFDLTSLQWTFISNMQIKSAGFATALDSSTSKVYLVGGIIFDSTSSDFIPYFDTQIFDANSETFSISVLPETPSPLSRYYNTAAVISSKLYLIGGASVLCVDVLDLLSQTFYEPNPKFPDYVRGAAIFSYNNKLYVVDGGFYSPLSGNVYEFDPSTNSWLQKNGVDPQPRIYFGFGQFNNQLVVSSGMNTSGAVLSSAYIYDPSSDSFSQIVGAVDPNPSILPASVVYNGKLYLFGGRTTPSNPNSLIAKTRILDISSGTFTLGPDLPYALEDASAVAINDKIYIFGGSTLIAPDYINKNVIVFDPSSQTFTTSTSIPYPCYGSSATSVGSYAIFDSGYYLFYSTNINNLSGGPLPYIQVFDTQTNTFTTLPRPIARTNHSSIVLGNKFYSTCGDDGYWPESRLDIADVLSSGCFFTCSATASPENGIAPLTVNFTSSVSGSGCSGSPSFNWNFGDGSTSTEQNPTHIYQDNGNYNWTLTVTWGGVSCSKSGTISVGGCSVTCEATVSPLTGDVPLTVNFSASSTSIGCTTEVTYEWDFGDGIKSNEQNTSHTYNSAGNYTYSLTAKADSSECVKTGIITVTSPSSCILTCEAVANPSSGNAPLSVTFTGGESHSNCTGTPQFLWDFGDGYTSTEKITTHTYSNGGTFNWTFTVTLNDKSCSKSGSVTVTQPSDNPVIYGVSKASNPFRLKVVGEKFKEGCTILIDQVQVPFTKFKSSTYLVAKKGATLKAMVPKGVTVKIKVKNPDGSESNEYPFTR